MPISRRQFLTALAAVPAVAKIAPFLLKELASPSVESVSGPVSPIESGQLRFQDLENAYQQLCYGSAEPDLIVMSPDSYAAFMHWWTKLPNTGRFLLPDNQVSVPYFEGAAVSYSKALNPGTIAFINSKPPSEQPERYSGLFRRNYSGWEMETLENLKLPDYLRI